jgi:hypothetical protein
VLPLAVVVHEIKTCHHVNLEGDVIVVDVHSSFSIILPSQHVTL